jgi:UDP-glucose 4-epimerase
MSAEIIYPGNKDAPVIAVVGTGLIGQKAIQVAKMMMSTSRSTHVQFDWSDTKNIAAELIDRVNEEIITGNSRIEIIWCAGKGGFSATTEVMEKEFHAYQFIVQNLFSSYHDKKTINLVSSAGGLYEGVNGTVEKDTPPCPVRPYGEWKLKQENMLEEMRVNYRIFRPSTVYGLAQQGRRKGMLSVLISNTINNKPTDLHAFPDTLRDFVYVGDVARKMVGSALQNEATGNAEILATGRSISIQYLIQRVHRVVGRRPLIHFSPTSGNEGNMAFSNKCLPKSWHPATIEEGIALLVRLQQGYEN